MDQVFHTDDAVFAQVLLDDLIVAQRQTLRKAVCSSLDLSISTLVNELAYTLKVGVSVSDEWFAYLQHFNGSLGQANEDARVDLDESQQLKSLALLGVNLVDTEDILVEFVIDCGWRCIPLDTHDKHQFGFGWNIERALLLGNARKSDLFSLLITVFLDVRFGSLEDHTTLLLVGLLTTELACCKRGARIDKC